jgi:uncharacterized membrane protein
MNVKIFPTIMIILSVGSAVNYAIAGNWRMALYWLAASTLTTTITY